MKNDSQPEPRGQETDPVAHPNVWLELSPLPEFFPQDPDQAARDPHDSFRLEVCIPQEKVEGVAEGDLVNIVLTKSDLRLPSPFVHLFGVRRPIVRKRLERFLVHAQIRVESVIDDRIKARIVHGSAGLGPIGPRGAVELSEELLSRLWNPSSDVIDALIMGAALLQFEVRRPGGGTVRSGSFQAGCTASRFVLDAGADDRDDFYNGALIEITAGAAQSHVRWIDDYVGSTRTALLRPQHDGTAPAADDTFEIREPDRVVRVQLVNPEAQFEILAEEERIWELIDCQSRCGADCLRVLPAAWIAERVDCLASALSGNRFDPELSIVTGSSRAPKRVLFYTRPDDAGVYRTDEVIAPAIVVEFGNRFRTRWTPLSLIVRVSGGSEQFRLTDIPADAFGPAGVPDAVMFRWAKTGRGFLAELLQIGNDDAVSLPLMRSTSEVANRAGSLWQYADVIGGAVFPGGPESSPAWIGYDLPEETSPEMQLVDPQNLALTERLAIRVPNDSPGLGSRGWRFELPPIRVGDDLQPSRPPQASNLQMLFCLTPGARGANCADQLTSVLLDVSLRSFHITAESPELFAYSDLLQSPRSLPVIARPLEHVSRQRLVFHRSETNPAGLSLQAARTVADVPDRCAPFQNTLQLVIQIADGLQPVRVFQPVGRAMVSFVSAAGDNATAPEVDGEGNLRYLPDPTRGLVQLNPRGELVIRFPENDLQSHPTNQQIIGQVELAAFGVPDDQGISSLFPWMVFAWAGLAADTVPSRAYRNVAHQLMHKNMILELEEFHRRPEQIQSGNVDRSPPTAADVGRLTRDRFARAATWDTTPANVTVPLTEWFPRAELCESGGDGLTIQIGFDDAYDDGTVPPRPRAVVWDVHPQPRPLSDLKVFYREGGERSDWLAFEPVQLAVAALNAEPRITFDVAPVAGTAQGGDAASITLDVGEPDQDDVFIGRQILVTGGVGAGQIRLIEDYSGASRVARVDRPWDDVPDATSTYLIPRRRFQPLLFDRESAGQAQDGSATTIRLADAEPAQDHVFVGRQILITSGPGAYQVRTIDDYVGATRVARVDPPWDDVPDAASNYLIPPQFACDNLSVLQSLSIQAADPTHFAIRDQSAGTCRMPVIEFSFSGNLVTDNTNHHHIAFFCDGLRLKQAESGKYVPVEPSRFQDLDELGVWRVLRRLENADEFSRALPWQLWPTISGQAVVPMQIVHVRIDRRAEIPLREIMFEAVLISPREFASAGPSEFPPGVAAARDAGNTLHITVCPDAICVSPSLIEVTHSNPKEDGFLWQFGVEHGEEDESTSSDGLARLSGKVRLDQGRQKLVLSGLRAQASVWGELWPEFSPPLTLESLIDPEHDLRGFESPGDLGQRLRITTPADPLVPERVDEPVEHLLRVPLDSAGPGLVAELDAQSRTVLLVDGQRTVEAFTRGIYHGFVLRDGCLLLWIEAGPTVYGRCLQDDTTVAARARIGDVSYSGTRTMLTASEFGGDSRTYVTWDLVAEDPNRAGWQAARLLISSQLRGAGRSWVTGHLAIQYALDEPPGTRAAQGPVIVEVPETIGNDDPLQLGIVEATYDAQPVSVLRGVGQSLGDNDVVRPDLQRINIERTAIEDNEQPRFAKFGRAFGQASWTADVTTASGAPIFHVRPDGSQLLFGTRGDRGFRVWQFTSDGTPIERQEGELSVGLSAGLNDAAFLPDGLIVFAEGGTLKLLLKDIISDAQTTSGARIDRVLRVATDPAQPGLLVVVQGDGETVTSLDVSLWRHTELGFAPVEAPAKTTLTGNHAVLSAGLARGNLRSYGALLELDARLHGHEVGVLTWNDGSLEEDWKRPIQHVSHTTTGDRTEVAVVQGNRVNILEIHETNEGLKFRDTTGDESIRLDNNPRATDLHAVHGARYLIAATDEESLLFERPVAGDSMPLLRLRTGFRQRLMGDRASQAGVVMLDAIGNVGNQWRLSFHPRAVVEALQVVDPATLPVDRCTDEELSRPLPTTINHHPQLWHRQAEGIRLMAELPTKKTLASEATDANLGAGQWSLAPVMVTEDDLIAFASDAWIEHGAQVPPNVELKTDTLILLDRQVPFSVLLNRTFVPQSGDAAEDDRRLLDVVRRSAWYGPAVVRSLLPDGSVAFHFVTIRSESPQFRPESRSPALRRGNRVRRDAPRLLPADVAAGAAIAAAEETHRLHLKPTRIPVATTQLPGHGQDIRSYLLTRPEARHQLGDTATVGLHFCDATAFDDGSGTWARADLKTARPTMTSRGTARAASANTITLQEEASPVERFFVGAEIVITGGPGKGQRRQIDAYDGIARQANVDRSWDSIPNATSEYLVQGCNPGRSYLPNHVEFRIGPHKPGSMMHHAWQVQVEQDDAPHTFVPPARCAGRDPLLLADQTTARVRIREFEMSAVTFRDFETDHLRRVSLIWEHELPALVVHSPSQPLAKPDVRDGHFIEFRDDEYSFREDNHRLFATGVRIDQRLFEFPEYVSDGERTQVRSRNPDLPVQLTAMLLNSGQVEGREIMLPQLTLVTRIPDLGAATTATGVGGAEFSPRVRFFVPQTGRSVDELAMHEFEFKNVFEPTGFLPGDPPFYAWSPRAEFETVDLWRTAARLDIVWKPVSDENAPALSPWSIVESGEPEANDGVRLRTITGSAAPVTNVALRGSQVTAASRNLADPVTTLVEAQLLHVPNLLGETAGPTLQENGDEVELTVASRFAFQCDTVWPTGLDETAVHVITSLGTGEVIGAAKMAREQAKLRTGAG